MNDKLNKLEELNKSLKPPQELSGVFLPSNSQKQFDFMFVAEMPSMNEPKNWDGESSYNFGEFDARCRFFWLLMNKYGVAGNYVTDIVKKRDTPRRPTKEEIKRWLKVDCFV